MNKITKDILNEYFKKYQKLNKFKEVISENIKTAQDRYGGVLYETIREKKKVRIEEKHLWEEVRLLGPEDHEAATYLKNKYPKIWEMQESEQKMVKEIRDFEVRTFGFHHKEMTMDNMVRLIDALVDYRMENRKKRKIMGFFRGLGHGHTPPLPRGKYKEIGEHREGEATEKEVKSSVFKG